jgi:hypothetical protein
VKNHGTHDLVGHRWWQQGARFGPEELHPVAPILSLASICFAQICYQFMYL